MILLVVVGLGLLWVFTYEPRPHGANYKAITDAEWMKRRMGAKAYEQHLLDMRVKKS